MDPAPKTFLFVNKTPSSRLLSRTEGAERAHVQRHSQQARRSRENRTGGTGPPWDVNTQPVKLGGAAQRNSRLARPSPTTSANRVSPSAEDGSQNATKQVLTLCPSRNGSDPFNCTIAGSDIAHYHHTILGFISGQSPKVTFFAEAFAPETLQRKPLPMRHDVAVANRLKGCVQDKALLYSTLAYGASLLGWMGGVPGAFKPVDYFTGQAIQAVRERILSPASRATSKRKSDSGLAMSIYSLAISELWKTMPLMRNRGSHGSNLAPSSRPKRIASTSRMHLHALLELVNSSGGWRQFDPYILESAILVDKYLACWEWTAPIIAINSLPLEYSLHVSEMDIKSVVLGRNLLSGIYDPKLRAEIENIIRFVYFANQAWALAPLPFDVQSGLYFKLQHLIYELLYLVDLAPIDNCVRMAALIFLQSCMSYRGAHICAVILTTHLRSALVSARFWEPEFDSSLRFWCLCSALLLTETSSDEEWFRGFLTEYSKDITSSPHPLDTARSFLEPYLYLDDRQGRQLGAVIASLDAKPAV